MGRQIQVYVLPADVREFVERIQRDASVIVTRRDAESADIQTASDSDIQSRVTLCLWNRSLLPELKRKWIPDPGYYRIDSLRLPVLEFLPSFMAEWEGKPALGQGRLFGNFETYLDRLPDFEKWYEFLARWIKKHYRKGPVSRGGFVAPQAYDLYSNGGYLLPAFLPPRTEEWISEIGRQHGESKSFMESETHSAN